jgi:AcrR family transcriptional regulator
MMGSMAKQGLSTKDRLINTVSDMLDGAHPQHILVEDVLSASGVARGSLYHHFGDFPALIEATLVRRFTAGVDYSNAVIGDITATSTSATEFFDRMYEMSADAQHPERAHRRAERARELGMAHSNERFRALLSVEQERLTNTLVDAVEVAKVKGWIRKDLDSRAIAVFLQAYTLGRAVDDVAITKVEPEAWNTLIRAVTLPLANSAPLAE